MVIKVYSRSPSGDGKPQNQDEDYYTTDDHTKSSDGKHFSKSSLVLGIEV